MCRSMQTVDSLRCRSTSVSDPGKRSDRSQSLRNRRSKDRDLMCIASVRTSFSFFVDGHVDCWLCTVHIVHIASGHKSGSEVTWRSWSPDSQVFLRKLSDLRSLPQHCKILLDLEEFSSNQFLLVADNSGGCLQMQKRKFQSFKVLKFHGQSIKQLISSSCVSTSKYWIGVRSRMIMKPICKKIDKLCSLQIFCIRDRQQENLMKQHVDIISFRDVNWRTRLISSIL